MKPDLKIQLGAFEFVGQAVPQSIKIGGTQNLAVHQLVGGKRIIDAMGPQPEPLSWSGWLVGEQAMEQYLYLNALRAQGKELAFSFGDLSYQVVVSSFTADFQRRYQMPYTITLEVVTDESLKGGLPAVPQVKDLLADDGNTAQSLADKLKSKFPSISSAVSTVQSAIGKISDFAKATTAEINSVLEPIREARDLVRDATATVENTIQSVTTLGGILPDNPVSQSASRMIEQVNAHLDSENLYTLDSVLGRMQTNTGNANTGNKSVTMAGGSLYNVAANEYGDASAWTSIARANNLLDPVVDGVKNLIIPAKPDGAGGVMNV